MRLGKAAQSLGVTDRTIRNWIDRPDLHPYFSTQAVGAGAGLQREISDNDLFVLNTIRVMRSTMANNDTDWNAIAERLSSGRLERELPPQAAAISNGLSMLGQVGVSQERDQLAEQVNELKQRERELQAQIVALHETRHTEQATLYREMAEINAAKVRAETELEMWRTGWRKPSK